jgi:hypothetical protein
VNLQSVKYIPSGFFGMLYEWYENGIHVQLHSPQPNVEQMLWFRMFFHPQNGATFFLNDEAVLWTLQRVSRNTNHSDALPASTWPPP